MATFRLWPVTATPIPNFSERGKYGRPQLGLKRQESQFICLNQVPPNPSNMSDGVSVRPVNQAIASVSLHERPHVFKVTGRSEGVTQIDAWLGNIALTALNVIVVGEDTPPLNTNGYVNLNPKATDAERSLGTWLDEQARRGQLAEIRRVRGMPEKGPGRNPDFHLFRTQFENTELWDERLNPDLRGDAVMATGEDINDIIQNAIDFKTGSQADVLFIEIPWKGEKGKKIDDHEITWTRRAAFQRHHLLKKLMVIRNTHGIRAIVIDWDVRK